MIEEHDLRGVVSDFVDRMFDDFVIGFLFEGKDKVRIKTHEFELARRHLLGVGRYAGRPVGPLHRSLRINRGQFRRRLAILRTVATQAGVDPEVVAQWVAHDAALESVITDGTDCLES